VIYALSATHVLLIIVPYRSRFVNTQVCKDPLKPFRQAHPLVQLVTILLLIEALALAAVFFALTLELLSGNVLNVYAEIFLIVLALGATAWVLNFTRGLLNKKRWARSAAFFWQLLQGVIGAGALAEESSNRMIGIFLVVLSGATVLLLFNKQVVEQTNEENEN
jgi:hypothetical protein